ncbi:hypothetical protein NDU88_003473 [Pleurodeles waltl]|uniref:Uncharacterized protein n=1 Tax=Pleurodeles waltl TaxID=8319 RepID=A0AAV7WT50_PLEWA|nr:hypothetical protein NDU88_003473 [Pleurodeles waltl]
MAPIDSWQMQMEEYEQGTQDIQDIVDKPLKSRFRKGERVKLVGDDAVKDSELEASKSGRGAKITEWSRDGGDKFYSLTEDSEAISSVCNQREAEGSISSESERASSAVGPTVKSQRQHRKCIRSWSGSTGGADLSGRSATALKWHYSEIRLTSLEKDPKADTPPNVDAGENCQSAPINNTVSTDAKMLQMIYDTIRELQTETQAESRRAWMATKQLQDTVRKFAKSCMEIEEKLNTMENRTSIVEAEVEALKEQAETQRGQLTDIILKLEDYGNRQRRNNL